MQPTLGSAHTIDRKAEKRADSAWLESVRGGPDARFLVLADYKPVIASNSARTEAQLRWFTRGQLEDLGLPVADALFLGIDRASGAGRFAVPVTEHRARNAPGGIELMRPIVDLRSLAMQGVMDGDDMSIVGLAKALAHWHDGNRCCGHCGGTTLVKDGGWKRKCWACGQEHFPRVDPVVIMLIVDPQGERCLLGHAARFDSKMYSALAGFVEPGEGIEEAVRRETLEEAGIEVGEVRYHSAQPWPFPHSLMIGCFGMARTTDITIDTEELTDARWFTRAEIADIFEGRHADGIVAPKRHAIAHTLLTTFARGEVAQK